MQYVIDYSHYANRIKKLNRNLPLVNEKDFVHSFSLFALYACYREIGSSDRINAFFSACGILKDCAFKDYPKFQTLAYNFSKNLLQYIPKEESVSLGILDIDIEHQLLFITLEKL